MPQVRSSRLIEKTKGGLVLGRGLSRGANSGGKTENNKSDTDAFS